METPEEAAHRTAHGVYLDLKAAEAVARFLSVGSPTPAGDFADWLYLARQLPEFDLLLAYFVLETRRRSGQTIPFVSFVDTLYAMRPDESFKSRLESGVQGIVSGGRD